MLTTTSAISGVLALGLGLLVLRGDVTLLWVQGFALALGMVSSFERPAASAILFELTGPAEVSNAVAVNMSLTSVARLLGPAVAGALIAGVGIGWCFMVNAGSYLFASAGMTGGGVCHRKE